MTEFKRRLKAGELLVAPMITIASETIPEVLSGSGFDWFFIDAEHGIFETRDIQNTVRAAGHVPCLVRLASPQPTLVGKTLDTGAAGVIVPMVNTPEQATALVRAAKYPPDGTRGVGLGRAHGNGFRFNEYLSTANDDVVVVLQAEHIDAVDNIEAIVLTPGLDGILVGPYDLSASMGLIGQVDHPDVQAAIARVADSCKKQHIPLGVFGVSADAVRPYVDNGFNLVVAGVDTVMLGQAGRRMQEAVRSGNRDITNQTS